MEELRRVYEAEPKGQFPPETARLFGFPCWRPADYREWMSLSKEWRTALDAKQSEWAERYRKLLPDFEKAQGIIEKEPAYGWFRLCLDEAQLEEFQREMENYATTDAPLHFSHTKANDREWLAKWTADISARLK